MEKLMLKIDNVSKMYKLGQIGGTTLRDELQRLGAKMRGKEDPTKCIGARDYNKGETFMALDGVSLEVKKGERVGIIGHNGAGKSTLLKLISRVTSPTGGAIGLNGRVASMLEVGTGFHGELTGRENVYMNGAILGMTRKEIDAKIEDIIDFSECRQFIDTPVKRYSSGMYVKLAFSVAAHLDSEIMIMDEVLAVGDMAFQKKCLTKMNDVSRTEGRTILYVSHNMSTIRELCDRVIVLDHGKVIYDGDVEDGIAVYMGSRDKNKSKLSYDFSDLKRDAAKSFKIRLCSLDIIDHKDNVYARGEHLRFRLHCSNKESAENIRFRMELLFADSSVAGASLSEDSFNFPDSGDHSLVFDFNTENLAEGKYSCILLAYETDSYGHQMDVDRVEPAFFFEVMRNASDEVIWLHQYWGHTHYGDVSVTEEKM